MTYPVTVEHAICAFCHRPIERDDIETSILLADWCLDVPHDVAEFLNVCPSNPSAIPAHVPADASGVIS